MPLFAFACEAGHTWDVYAKTRDDLYIPSKCNCGGDVYRNYAAERKVIRTTTVPGGIFNPALPPPPGFEIPDHIKGDTTRVPQLVEKAYRDYYTSNDVVNRALNVENENRRICGMDPMVETTVSDAIRANGLDPKEVREKGEARAAGVNVDG